MGSRNDIRAGRRSRAVAFDLRGFSEYMRVNARFGADQGPTWTYVLPSVVVATANASGARTAVFTYDPFGEPNATTGVRFRFTGQQFLSTPGLYYYKARFYSAALGRFLQTDPVGYRDDENLYAYVGNNPINAIDSTGLASVFTGGSFVTGANNRPGDLQCSGGRCQSGGDYGTSGYYQFSSGILCQKCALYKTGAEDLPVAEQADILRPFTYYGSGE